MKTCKQELCTKTFYAREMCQMHYKRWLRNGNSNKVLRLGELNSNYKHGMHGTKIYKAWQSMHSRCKHKMGRTSQYYKENGITVCERWADFDKFFEDMGPTYRDGLTLDRKDNSLGYSKDNCRWATMYEQSRNKTNNVWVDYKGKRMILKDLADEVGMKYVTLQQRVGRYGYTVDDAISKPVQKRNYKV